MHLAADLYAVPAAPENSESPQLTPTQLKVLRCVRSGLLNKQIAFELGMAEATVKVHMTALMRKLKRSEPNAGGYRCGSAGAPGFALRQQDRRTSGWTQGSR